MSQFLYPLDWGRVCSVVFLGERGHGWEEGSMIVSSVSYTAHCWYSGFLLSHLFFCYVNVASGGTVGLDNLGAMCLFRVIVYLSSMPYDVLIRSFGPRRAMLFPSLGEQLFLASFTIYRKKFRNVLGRCFSTRYRCSSHKKVTESITKCENRSHDDSNASHFTIVKIYTPSHSSGPCALDHSCLLLTLAIYPCETMISFPLWQNRSAG